MDYLQVGDTALEYRWIGPSPQDAPTLVFLHEGLGCTALWKDFPDRVAEATGWGVLAYSRAGYGGSDPVDVPRPLTYMHTEGLEILPRLLDAADVRQTILVGHSDGASIALINVGGVQDPRVIGAAIMAPHVFNEQRCVDSIRQAKVAYESGELREGLARYHGANVDVAFWGWNRAWLDPEFWHWNLEEYLPPIEIPLLLIQGKDDQYGTAAQIDAIERQVSGLVATTWLPQCGHSPHRDQPDATLRSIADFVSSFDITSDNSSLRAIYNRVAITPT